MRTTILLLLCFGVGMALWGCDTARNADASTGELHRWVDKNVRVQFRRDALGAAAPLPVSPTTNEINGASTTVVGQLMKVDGTGIVIGPDDRPKWIPRAVILFVEAHP